MESKLAAISKQSAKVDKLILANIAQYAAIQDLIEAMVLDPNAETAREIDRQFKGVTAGLEAVSNAITVLVKNLVEDDGDETLIDVREDENGIILS